MKRGQILGLAVVLTFALSLIAGTVAAQEDEPNVGLLRVYDVGHPRQVAPSSKVAFTIDVEYGIRFNATIKSAMFQGSPEDLGDELWHSDPDVVSGGGDRRWNVTLTAPSSEQEWILTVLAYYLEQGKWKYYPESETFRGPGVARVNVKIASMATLEINLGASDIPVMIDGSTAKTAAGGSVTMQLPVGGAYQIGIEPIVSRGESTRLVFVGWDDGSNATARSLVLDGDSTMTGTYEEQYRLRVNSPLSAYDYSAWYDPGTVVPLSVDPVVVPMSGILGALGFRYIFHGWSGDVKSNANSINVTMDQPKVINADFSLDYTAIVIPAIVAVGVVGAVVLVGLRLRAEPEPTAVEKQVEEQGPADTAAKFCDGCGELVEDSWEHCTKCGRALRPSKSSGDESSNVKSGDV